MKISKELYTFFKEWLEWATGDAEDGEVFSRAYGLGVNADCYGVAEDTMQELTYLINTTFNNELFPFGEDFHEREIQRTQHLCPKRLAFVREQIALYESYVENE